MLCPGFGVGGMEFVYFVENAGQQKSRRHSATFEAAIVFLSRTHERRATSRGHFKAYYVIK